MPVALGALPIAWIPGVTTWIVVWSALAAATAAIVVLMRSRWRDVKPWKKCALLSLWVHVLLACLAANIRIGVGTSGGPGVGPGEGGPIRVAVIGIDADVLEALAGDPPQGEPDAAPIAYAPIDELEENPTLPPVAAEPELPDVAS